MLDYSRVAKITPIYYLFLGSTAKATIIGGLPLSPLQAMLARRRWLLLLLLLLALLLQPPPATAEISYTNRGRAACQVG